MKNTEKEISNHKLQLPVKRIIIPAVFAVIILQRGTAYAQLGRGALEDINQHRKEESHTSVIQSFDNEPDTLSWGSRLISTWDFLEETEEEKSEAPTPPLDLDTIEGRIEILRQDIVVPYAVILKDYIEEYLVKHRRSMPRIIGKYQYYFPVFHKAFKRYGIPDEICALAVVESALNPRAVSKMGAVGTWQFMPETAKRFGLTVNAQTDERYDVTKSVDAAARYLLNAFKRFRDWRLAIASYNCGPENVEYAIRKAGSTAFWDIYPFLPMETRGYLPAFTAALYTLTFYKEHDIQPKTYTEGRFTSYSIKKRLSFERIERVTGCSTEELAALNPQYLDKTVHGSDKKAYILRIPKKYEKHFDENIELIQ